MASHELVKLYIEEQRRILDVFPVDDVCRVVDLIWDAYTQDKTVYAFANGGGAGLVGNLVCDLSNHPFVFEDKTVPYPDDLRRLKVRNLSVDASMLTGVANDLGYAEVFARPLQTELEARDVVLGISGSGNSENVVRAFEVARAREAHSILISRGNGGRARQLCELCLLIPGTSRYPGQTGKNDNNFHFEDAVVSITHMLVGQLCDRVRMAYSRGTYHRRVGHGDGVGILA